MNPPPPRDDLDDWLDGLRGRARPGGSPAAAAEAQAQRDAIAAAHAEHGDDDGQELQRLLFRMRREGVLHASPQAKGATAERRWGARLPLAAAAVLALGLAITMVGPGLWQAEEPPVLRSGTAEQVLEVDAAQVAATAQQLADALRALGAAVAVTPLPEGATEVAATVPKEQLGAAAQALARFGLAPPAADGTLRIELRPRGVR